MSSKKNCLKILVFIFCYTIPCYSYSNIDFARIFKNHSCIKDLQRYYPPFLEGQLTLKQQDRFFDCAWAVLEAVVNKKIITHTPERDHFTEYEFFKMFHFLFKYDEEKSKELTKKLLFYKKILVGGSIKNIKDKEFAQMFKLMPDYKEAYYIIHKEIPVLKKLFRGERVRSRKKTLEQLRKTTLLLSRAYKRDSISYTIEDLSKYPEYAGQENLQWTSFFTILQNLFEGTLYPHKAIQGENWTVFVNVIRRSFNLLFYHNQHLANETRDIQLAYNVTTALEKSISILASNERLFLEKGFPLKNIDNILQSSLKIINFKNSTVFSRTQSPKHLRFLTRVFFTLSLKDLNTSDKKAAYSDWESESSLVDFVFPDSRFSILEDGMIERSTETDYFVSSKKIKYIETWAENYKKSLHGIYNGSVKHTAREKGMRHWLNLFFGWNEEQKMITYGVFEKSNNLNKMTHLLAYEALLSLLLKSYVPEDYFKYDDIEISKQDWDRMVSDLVPALAISYGGKSFQYSLIKSTKQLFNIADLFLNSSDANNKLNRKELLDLNIHLVSALKHSQKTSQKLSDLCDTDLFLNCVTQTLMESPEMLEPYPRFKDFIFPVKKKDYKKDIQTVLANLTKEKASSKLLELFFLIQIMEVNYYEKIDTNLSFNLEFEELLTFAHSLKEPLFSSIPHLHNPDQALAFLLYSFQFKEIPFFTGTELETVRFTQWYLNPKVRSHFSITPNHFHNLVFKFYSIYKRF